MSKDRRFTVVRGSYQGTSDDRLDRWYIEDRESRAVDRRGQGFKRKADAQYFADLWERGGPTIYDYNIWDEEGTVDDWTGDPKEAYEIWSRDPSNLKVTQYPVVELGGFLFTEYSTETPVNPEELLTIEEG